MWNIQQYAKWRQPFVQMHEAHLVPNELSSLMEQIQL